MKLRFNADIAESRKMSAKNSVFLTEDRYSKLVLEVKEVEVVIGSRSRGRLNDMDVLKLDTCEEGPSTVKLERNFLELDLDYLERRQVPCSPCTPGGLSQVSPDAPELVKLVLLGAPGVGKTSIIQQFVWNSFKEEYFPTSCRHTYYPTVIVDGRVYELKITDLPAVPYIPVDSVYELADCPVRDATVYMLVLDLSDLETFQYLETVREQILESRELSDIPALVVANKIDLFDTEDDASLERRRVLMDRVSMWGCGYAECSARYDSLVRTVFRRLLESVRQHEANHNPSSQACPSVFGDPLGGYKCSIL